MNHLIDIRLAYGGTTQTEDRQVQFRVSDI